MSSFRKPLTVLRTTGGYFDDDGYWHDGMTGEITISASVQPLESQAQRYYTQMLGEGAFTSLMVALYSDEPLLPEKQADGQRPMQEGDIVLWRDRRMKVIQCEPWQNDVINHYRSVAQEIEVVESDSSEETEADDGQNTEEISP